MSDLGASCFYESGYVAYQIKGNEAYNNMHANSLPLNSHSGSKGQNIFSEGGHVAYQRE